MGPRVSVLVEPTSAVRSPKDFYRSDSDWRDEVANRVQAHKARRRRRGDPGQSLSLAFHSQNAAGGPGETVASNSAQQYQQTSNAPELHAQEESCEPEENGDATHCEAGRYETPIYEEESPSEYRRILIKQPPAEKILLQFPRPAEQNRLFENELAEPIFATPRILDLPEVATDMERAGQIRPPLATFHWDDYVHEAEGAQWQTDEADDGQIELPLQVAPVGARTMCALTDAVVVMTAAALFSVIVLSIAKFVPQGRMAAMTAMLLPLTFWAAYHYLFLVYAGKTLGMQMAQLELSSFEGCVPTRSVRGWRAVSMMLSCTSLGLGFAWAMVDEDRLGWHDRITRTYLRQS